MGSLSGVICQCGNPLFTDAQFCRMCGRKCAHHFSAKHNWKNATALVGGLVQGLALARRSSNRPELQRKATAGIAKRLSLLVASTSEGEGEDSLHDMMEQLRSELHEYDKLGLEAVDEDAVDEGSESDSQE